MKAYKYFLYRNKKEENENWRNMGSHIPYLELKSNWKIKVIPPFSGVAVRFLILDINTNKYISVYLDTNEALGMFGGDIYWEIYPNKYSENSRFSLNDVDAMIKAIQESFNAGYGIYDK